MSEPLDRRRLLARAGALAVAPGTLAAWGYDAAPHGWAAVRRQFALARDETNLSTFLLLSFAGSIEVLTQIPGPVAGADQFRVEWVVQLPSQR